MWSLTLAIWGACRTLDGPGFEPLISMALKLISFDDKESLEGIFRNGSLSGAVSPVVCAGLPLATGDVAQYVRCGAGRVFSGGGLG